MTGISDESGLRHFVEMHVAPTLAAQDLPYLRFAHECDDDLAALCAVDHEISAWKLASEIRDASTTIGRRRLAALRAVNGLPRYSEFVAEVEQGRAHGHHLTVCALQAAGEGFPLEAALGAWFYQSVAGVCSAAPKLLRIGQDGCQRVLRAALGAAESTISASLAVAREDAGYFDPLLEIASMRHEFSDERLFIS